MNIAMFTDSYLPEVNGVVTSVASYAAALRRRGHTVTIIAPASSRNGTRDAGDEENAIIRLASATFPMYPDYRMAFPGPLAALRRVEALRPDIVHVHSGFVVGAYGAWFAKRRHMPLVGTYHTLWTEYTHYSPLGPALGKAQMIWLSRTFCNACDRIIAPTERVRAILRHDYAIATPIEVLPSGLSAQVLEADPARAAALRAERGGGPALLYAGRLGHEKNLHYLLDAIIVAHALVPHLRSTIAGCGPLAGELRRRVQASGLEHTITLTGAVPQRDLATYYAASDAFVFASTTETQGLVLLEAMAHGLPVIAYASDVSREVVGTDAGIVIDGGPDVFAAQLASLLKDQPRRDRMAQAARARALPYHSDRLVTELEGLYMRALDGDRVS